jgi:hypothetical protein
MKDAELDEAVEYVCKEIASDLKGEEGIRALLDDKRIMKQCVKTAIKGRNDPFHLKQKYVEQITSDLRKYSEGRPWRYASIAEKIFDTAMGWLGISEVDSDDVADITEAEDDT